MLNDIRPNLLFEDEGGRPEPGSIEWTSVKRTRWLQRQVVERTLTTERVAAVSVDRLDQRLTTDETHQVVIHRRHVVIQVRVLQWKQCRCLCGQDIVKRRECCYDDATCHWMNSCVNQNYTSKPANGLTCLRIIQISTKVFLNDPHVWHTRYSTHESVAWRFCATKS